MSNLDQSLTFMLFARPSFLEGMARIVDLGGTLQVYNESKTAEEADAKALLSDWLSVGDDLRDSIRKYGESQEQVGCKSK